DMATGADVVRLGGPAGSAQCEHFAADGALYFVNGCAPRQEFGNELVRYDPVTGQARVLCNPLPGSRHPQYVVSPDGRVVAVHTPSRHGVRLLEATTG